jgi:hypothetical protein
MRRRAGKRRRVYQKRQVRKKAGEGAVHGGY